MTNLRRSVLKRLARGHRRSKKISTMSYYCINLLGYEAADLASYEDKAFIQLKEVFAASSTEVKKPLKLKETSDPLIGHLAAIRPYLFKNEKVRSDSPLLCSGGLAKVRQHAFDNRDRFSLKSGDSIAHEYEGRLYFKKESAVRLPRGICAFGPGANNWYHWLIETLPTVMLAQNLEKKYDRFPLLVPEEVVEGPTFKQTLDLFAGARKIIPLKQNVNYKVAKLILIPQQVFGPCNMQTGHWPIPTDYIQNIGVMQQFRSEILTKLNITYDPDSPKRVFLARPAGSRAYNQDEIIDVAQKMGCHIAHPEKLNFRQQVQLLHSADYVIGPTGAAWANSLFMRPGTRSFIWALEEYSGGCFFSNLAHVAGSQMTYCFVQADQAVASTYEAFGASYKLPVDVFTDHMKAIPSPSTEHTTEHHRAQV